MENFVGVEVRQEDQWEYILHESMPVADVGNPMCVGLYFNCEGKPRNEVIQSNAQQIMDSLQVKGYDHCDKLLEIIMPCGIVRTYLGVDAIPLIDIPCPCRNPNHWLIKYSEAEGSV